MISPLPDAPHDLDAFLPVPGAAGLYRMAWRRRAEVDRAVAATDFLVLVASLDVAVDKATLFKEFRSAFAMPGWVGANWDALADALRDLSWLGERAGYVLMLHGCEAHREAAPEDHATLLEVLRECTDDWREMDVPFWVFEIEPFGNDDGETVGSLLHFNPGT